MGASPPTLEAVEQFKCLMADVEARAYAVDDLYRTDALNVCNDHNFFPFLDILQVR